jgi:hypothetical protein
LLACTWTPDYDFVLSLLIYYPHYIILDYLHLKKFYLPIGGFVVSDGVGDGVDDDDGGLGVDVACCDVVVGCTSDMSAPETVEKSQEPYTYYYYYYVDYTVTLNIFATTNHFNVYTLHLLIV